jgi:hypothetical protein
VERSAGETPEIPGWFWTTLDDARPELSRLCTFLEAMAREHLVAFARAYRDAAEAVCDYWDGPEGFSEDDTEDLCNWIVGQGQVVWRRAIEAGPGALESLVRAFEAAEANPDSPGSWKTSVPRDEYRGWQSPSGIAYPIFARRFNADLHGFLEGGDAAQQEALSPESAAKR